MNQNNLVTTTPADLTSATTPVSATILWTALVTPFNENNTVDFTHLALIARKQAQAGNGILLLGSTGEGLALTSVEHQQIVEFVCQLNLNTPLMVAVGGYNLAEQVAWVKQCNQYTIDAFLLGTPIYAKPGAVGQTLWFEQLLDAANFPCMLYNVPSRSGVEIPLETVKNLKDHRNFWAMKEASGDINKFLAYRQVAANIDLYSGEDAMLPHLVNAGVKGLVSVCANAWPEASQRYVALALQSNGASLIPLWHKAIAALFSVANPIPVKVLMHLQGQINLPNLRAPLTHLELKSTAELLSFEQQINAWLLEQISLENTQTANAQTLISQVVGS